uniref:FAST kinase leucine-rich domain-containing protein n=1 Tax=Chlamydomonas euryale TaxID=1486919 RepID=A0A7R9V7V8_9CHLO|mmetsp:Transcript_23763/g.70548  ORF Transcript_23763/g.70548 Transcript_23763/m.70548 type:complete len:285 (+) Transcript_23763:523-1377(+)
MGGFNGSELATLSHSFASLGHSPSAPWLHAAMRAFHGALGSSATPPALAKMLHAMAHLRARPSRNWMQAVIADARRQIDGFTARELAVVLWSAVVMGHPPDAVFMSTWFVAAARRMASLQPEPALLALTALAATSEGATRPLPARFARLLVPHLQGMLPLLSAEQLCDVLRCLVALRVRPAEEWMADFESALESALPRLLDAERLGGLAWALGQMRYQPDRSCAAALMRAGGALLPGARAHDVGLLVWGLMRVELEAPPAWANELLRKAEAEGLSLPTPSTPAV